MMETTMQPSRLIFGAAGAMLMMALAAAPTSTSAQERRPGAAPSAGSTAQTPQSSQSLRDAQRMLDQTRSMPEDLKGAKAAIKAADYERALLLLRPHVSNKALVSARTDFVVACMGVFRKIGADKARNEHGWDFALAYEISRPFAEQGVAMFQYYVGEMMTHGLGTAVNRDEAEAWLVKAADQGNADAEETLLYEYML